MTKANIKTTFQSEIETVWRIVTSLDEYSWRSDISGIEIMEAGACFVEYTLEGFPTTFTITAFQPYERYAFDMENTRMRGHWEGLFSRVASGTQIDFTENVTAKNLFVKPFVKFYLKKQQAAYVRDLKNAMDQE
jgi:hypothetical protein